MSNYPQGLLDFIQQSPSCFHAIDIIKKQLTANGFLQLLESDSWELEAGKSYFVTRNLSSIIAFKVPRPDFVSFHIVASHSDSPTFKIKMQNWKLAAQAPNIHNSIRNAMVGCYVLLGLTALFL